MKKNRFLHVRVTENQDHKFDETARKHKSSKSKIIRELINQIILKVEP